MVTGVASERKKLWFEKGELEIWGEFRKKVENKIYKAAAICR